MLVFGLRGNVFRSDDGGGTGPRSTPGCRLPIVAAHATRRRRASLLAEPAGACPRAPTAARPSPGSRSSKPMPVTRLADVGGGQLALVGPRGVAVTELAAR